MWIFCTLNILRYMPRSGLPMIPIDPIAGSRTPSTIHLYTSYIVKVERLCIYIIHFLHPNFISYIMSLYHKTYQLYIMYHDFMISRPDQMIAKSKHNKERGTICPVSPLHTWHWVLFSFWHHRCSSSRDSLRGITNPSHSSRTNSIEYRNIAKRCVPKLGILTPSSSLVHHMLAF